MRLIETITNGTKVIKVRYNSEWQEYVVAPAGCSKNDDMAYHTSSKQDAHDTAVAMSHPSCHQRR